jgi:hypothetical protein
LGRSLECGFVRLAVDAHRVQALVTEPRRNRRKVHGLNEATASVMPKPVWMHVGDIRAPAALSDQVVNTPCRVRATLAVEDRTCRSVAPDGQQRCSRFGVEWYTTVFPAFAHDIEPA